MKARAAGLTIVLLLIALLLLALESAQRPPSSSAVSGQAATVRPASPAPPAIATLRDIFEYADEPTPVEPPPGAGPASESALLEPEPELPPAATGPRLVGVLRRGGQLLAALAVEDDVVLLAPGQAAAGVTVISIDDESVYVRLPDGSERTLRPSE